MGLANAPAYPNSFGAPSLAPTFSARGRIKWSYGAGAAGAYTVSLTQPAGSTLLDVVVTAVALWNHGTSDTGIVGDVTNDDGIFVGIDLKATDLLAGESISVALAGGKAGADIASSQFNRRYTAADRSITLKNTAVGTVASAGETILEIYWHFPTRGETAGAFAA